MDIPSPDTLKQYETLGIVGILLLVLAILAGSVGITAIWIARNIVAFVGKAIDYAKNFAAAHLQAMDEQTQTMARIEMKQEQIAKGQESWNRLLVCWLPACPIKKLFNENAIPVKDNHLQPPAGHGLAGAPSAPVDHGQH